LQQHQQRYPIVSHSGMPMMGAGPTGATAPRPPAVGMFGRPAPASASAAAAAAPLLPNPLAPSRAVAAAVPALLPQPLAAPPRPPIGSSSQLVLVADDDDE
jgi:hypothetical protein